jgi:hypothetical protein
MTKNEFSSTRPPDNTDFDVRAEQLLYNAPLEHRLKALGLLLPMAADQNQKIHKGCIVLVHKDTHTRKERRVYFQHNQAPKDLADHIWVVTENNNDPTGKSGIIVGPLQAEGTILYVASHSLLHITKLFTILQPDDKKHPYEYITGFVDIIALEQHFDTSGIARFIDPNRWTYHSDNNTFLDPNRGLIKLSEFVAEQQKNVLL